MLQQVSKEIGIVSLVPMNGWNANIVYEKLNIVTHKNSTFIAKQKNRGMEPFVGTNWEDFWMPLVSGVGIATTIVEYASTKITSPTPPESGWAEEMPELKPAEYVWTRVTITYTDGRKTIFYSVGAGGIPAKTSDLENDGDGTSPFATEKQLQAEKERAEAAEGTNKTAIETEASRAKAAEQANAEAIQSESARAKTAEAAEKTRAEGAEASLGNRITTIENKIPEQASASNKLADQAFVNSSINALAAFFITPTATGDKAFTTRAALLAATTFYNGGKPRVPTQNDYAIVLADESQPKGVDGTYPTTRYSYQGGTYPNGQWEFQYIVNNTSLTQAQVDAINSGITKELVAQITTNKNDIAAIKTKNSEQDASIASLTTRIGNVESKNSSQDEEIAAVKAAVSNAQERADDAYTLANGKYSKPSGGIPADDLAGGIPASKITGLPTIPSSLPPSGAAGGDLTGTYPNPSLSATLKALINGAMPKSGGTFTGGISVTGGASIDTSGYVVGTWLATTKATDLGSAAQKIAVIGTSGSAMNYIYYRTPAELRGDIGAGTYSKPSGGIPADDLAGGIPASKITGLPTIPSSLPPSGAAGGDLTGTYPNPSLSATLKALINGAMPKSGGAFTGQVSWNATSLPALSTPQYFVTIEPFASGGKMYYSSVADARKGLGLATVATSGKYSDLSGLPNIPAAYTLPAATASVLGGVKLGSDTVQTVAANTPIATQGRTYAVQKNNLGQLVVNVPWENTHQSLANYYTKSETYSRNETTQQINSAISSAITTVLNTPV